MPNQSMKPTSKVLTYSLPLISTCRFAHLCRSRPRGSIREQAGPFAMRLQRVCHDTLPWLICFSLGEEIYPMNSKITPAQLSSGVLYAGAKSKALSRIIYPRCLDRGVRERARSSGTVR
jgi:hypothetical protein